MNHSSVYPVIRAAAEAFRPPRRVTVAQGAADVLMIREPGGYTGPWSPEETPYMVEPMNALASRRHEAVAFVGPSRTGKTKGLIEGWMSHVVCHDPGDMLIVQMSQDKAREFSKTGVDRAIRYSPALRDMMSGGNNDNTHDKLFKHGMWLKIGWPTASQLSSSTYRYVALTDYDRMPDNIDGEGDAFGLGLTRTRTFLSRGMCVVESSPGREIIDPNWRAATPHEAPPCTGVLGVYNRSDRRRWYWPCPDCIEFFHASPGLDLFNLPREQDLLEIVRTEDLGKLAEHYARITCPHCGSVIDAVHKHRMNQRGVWLADHETIRANGVREGEPAQSSIAGFWLGGVSAAYQSWSGLLRAHLGGLREYALTGSELPLQKTVNTDQGMPYLSRLLADGARHASDPFSRKEKQLERFIVPDDARYLCAAVDVQGGAAARFVVQVHACGPHMEQWLIDRYSIETSKRSGVDGNFAPIDPASYPEDWDLLTELVVDTTYRLQQEGRELRIKMIAVDTGGEGKKGGGDGVTDKAYDWYRRLRREGKHGRVMLIKGASTKNAPLVRESWVGARNKSEKGDVPLYLLNPNMLKDMVSTSLKRALPGPGYMHFPEWIPKSFKDEMSAEVRSPGGVWGKIRKRNEAFDLSAYVRACGIRLGVDKINWENPPSWAQTLDQNSDVISSAERRVLQIESMAGKPVPVRARRRSGGSSYLR